MWMMTGCRAGAPSQGACASADAGACCSTATVEKHRDDDHDGADRGELAGVESE